MKKLFIHHPLFRLLSPVFSGVIIYLLLLLINNDVAQVLEQFLGQELYLCIGLSFVIQEFSRLLLWVFDKFLTSKYSILIIGIQVVASIFLTVIIVTSAIQLYFENVLGYTPDSSEIWLFNSIFAAITSIYILLHISHKYLYKVNTAKLQHEQLKKQLIEDDFDQFRKGINPQLLFESLEALIIQVQQDNDKVDEIIDYLAEIYRFILSRKERQLVAYHEEKQVVNALIKLFKFLPYRNIQVTDDIQSDFFVVPGTLLNTLEYIAKTTIKDFNNPLDIHLTETDDSLQMTYSTNDKIEGEFSSEDLGQIKRVYKIYSAKNLEIETNTTTRIITFPKLIITN